MLNSKAFANSAALVVIAASFICWLVTVIMPDFAFNVANSWFHMINLDTVRSNTTSSFGEALYGFVTLGVVAWVDFFAFAEIYNRLAKKK